MISINDYLDEILEDFKEYVESGEKLCKLKDVHFDAGRLPDYSDIHVQQLYLLRYAYAYAFEYKCMYQALMSRLNNKNQLSVTSVGCGAMIDYWSLKHVFPAQCKIKYIGVDKINWNYKKDICSCNTDAVEFWEGDFTDYITKKAPSSTDVYIFPKSISELSHHTINCICKAMESLCPSGKTVYFLFSLRADAMNLYEDMDKTKKMYDNIINLGFVSEDDPNLALCLEQDGKIRDLDRDFWHPFDVVDYLTSKLPNLCEQANACFDRDNCVERLSRFPILNSSMVKFQIFKFVKEA